MRRLVFAAWIALTGLAPGHGDLHDSIVRVTRQIAAAPADPALYLQRAGLHLAHEDYPAAAADYDRAEVLKGDLNAIRLGRGRVMLAMGRFADACAALDPLIAALPDHVEAHATRARARAGRGDVDGAAADFSTAIAKSARPEPEYYLERAEALAAARPPRFDDAIRGLDEGLARLGVAVITLQLAAIDLEEKAGRIDAALARLDRIAAGAARRESWLVMKGDLLRRAQRPADARRAYADALTALAALPPRARSTQSAADLERRARRALGELTAAE